jgi:hypothetical protein
MLPVIGQIVMGGQWSNCQALARVWKNGPEVLRLLAQDRDGSHEVERLGCTQATRTFMEVGVPPISAGCSESQH